MENTEMLRLLVKRCDERYVAQSLEFDLWPQGSTIEIVRDRSDRLIQGELGEAEEADQNIGFSSEELHEIRRNADEIQNEPHTYGIPKGGIAPRVGRHGGLLCAAGAGPAAIDTNSTR